MSLVVQLLLTFVSLVAGTTVVLTVEAYRSSIHNLESAALRDVRTAAEVRDEMLTQLLLLRQQHAEGFLLSLESICAEEDEQRNGFGWSEECLASMVQEFRTTERASGVLFMYRGRPIRRSGTMDDVFQPGALAALARRADGGTDFVVRGVRGEELLFVQFDGADVLSMFADHSGLGATGEVFLWDGLGVPLTPLRYASQSTPGVFAAEPFQPCQRGPGESIQVDYRGVETVHGFRPVSGLDGGCIDAHVTYEEALAPAEAQRDELTTRGIAFVLIGAVLSILLARQIAAPVRRLVRAARTLQRGEFDAAVPIAGPSEVRTLGLAFEAMAMDLEKLVRREQAARQDAERANRSKDRFLVTISHELRTPVNAILGWTRLLEAQGWGREGIERATEAITRSAESQRRLIEDLLDVSRFESGRLRVERVPLRLAPVVERAVEAVRPRAHEKGVVLEAAITAEPIDVLGDEHRLQQVVWNLLWNSIKFTPQSGIVRLTLVRGDGRAELTVSDTGVGIPPSSLPHIFEWFRQGDAGEHAMDAGLGVGLALVKQIVELHEGSVSARSDGVGLGATFIVHLPTIDGV